MRAISLLPETESQIKYKFTCEKKDCSLYVDGRTASAELGIFDGRLFGKQNAHAADLIVVCVCVCGLIYIASHRSTRFRLIVVIFFLRFLFSDLACVLHTDH